MTVILAGMVVVKKLFFPVTRCLSLPSRLERLPNVGANETDSVFSYADSCLNCERQFLKER